MGAAFEVHKELGGGLAEELSHESLEIELDSRNIPFSSKEGLKVYYKEQLLKKKYFRDMLVYKEIVAELKSVKALEPAHEQQLLNYMHITKKPVGYLINFGPMKSVEWKRFILKRYISEN